MNIVGTWNWGMAARPHRKLARLCCEDLYGSGHILGAPELQDTIRAQPALAVELQSLARWLRMKALQGKRPGLSQN